MAKFNTREEWLEAFTNAARPMFEEAGAPIPENVRVSIGFSSKGAKSRTIGQCWAAEASEDNTFEIFVVPSMETSSRIADILTHELVHAAVGLKAGHGKEFRKVAVALGLGGKMTATVATEKWEAWANPILAEIGDIPHAALRTHGGESNAPKKQSTRMLKCECDSCGLVFRTSSKWADDVERCPVPSCEGEMKVERN